MWTSDTSRNAQNNVDVQLAEILCIKYQRILFVYVASLAYTQLLLFYLLSGFINLPLADQMNLLQSTWLDILCFNLAYRSVPFKGILVFADDFQCTDEDLIKYGSPPDLDGLTRKLARKLTALGITREEYVLLKAMLLLNPGKSRMSMSIVINNQLH